VVVTKGVRFDRDQYSAFDETGLATELYGIPVAGTMAHSYIQAHGDEREAFRAFTRTFPGTILLVDTYDTLEGVRR
jgi:nicotinate phosphoribosyltransferase